MTSSTRVVIPASANHCSGRRVILDASGIRALESFGRSIGIDSLEMLVMLPGYFRERRVWRVEIVPEPLVQMLDCV